MYVEMGKWLSQIKWPLAIPGGGDEQLLSSPVIEFEIWNNSDIFSSTFGIWKLFEEESFLRESKSDEIVASASAVSRLNWDLYWGVVVLGPETEENYYSLIYFKTYEKSRIFTFLIH